MKRGAAGRVVVVAATLVTPVAALASGIRGRSDLALALIVLSGVVADALLAKREV